MGDEQDSWFKPFGFDPAKAAKEVFDKGKAAVEAGVTEIKEDFNQAKAFVADKIDKGEKAIKSAVSPSAGAPKPAAAGGGSSGGEASSPSSLGGSVGRGGQNNPNDVKGIQRALGISDDGKCGPGTIQAIENFQKSLGQTKPDGRIDPGGPTSRALAGGASGGPAAAPSSPPAEDAGDSGSLFDRAVQGVKDFGGKIAKEAEEDFDAAKALGGRVIKGAEDFAGDAKKLGGTLLDGAGGGIPGAATSDLGSAASKLLKPDSGGTEVTFKERSLGKKKLGKFFEVELKVGGSVKFSGAPEGPDKPSKIEVKKGVLEFVASLWDEAVANFKVEKGAGIKGNTTKEGKGLSLGGAVTLKTNLGPLNLEFVPIEISLVNFDAKKGLSGPKASAGGGGNLAGKRTIKGVELELALAVTLSGELTPDYLAIAEAVVEDVLTDTATTVIIEVGLVLVAIGSVAGLVNELGKAVDESKLRGELELARNRFGNGLGQGYRDEKQPGDPWMAKGWLAGQKVFKEAKARVEAKANKGALPNEIREAAIDACSRLSLESPAVRDKISSIVGPAFWLPWIEANHGLGTFLGDARRVCGTCFPPGPIANNDSRLQQWKDRSDLPNFFSEKTP